MKIIILQRDPNKGKLIPVKDDYFNESINKQLDDFIQKQGLDVEDVMSSNFKNGVELVDRKSCNKSRDRSSVFKSRYPNTKNS
jgi:maleate cis-trans isomerase